MKYKTILFCLILSGVLIIVSFFVLDGNINPLNSDNEKNVIQQKAVENAHSLFIKGGSRKEILNILNDSDVLNSSSGPVLVEAGRLYLAMNEKHMALSCLKKAWNNEIKTQNLVLLLLNAFSGTPQERYKQIHLYLSELPANLTNKEFTASISQDLKQGAAAREIWQILMNNALLKIEKLNKYKGKINILNARYDNKIANVKNIKKEDIGSKIYELQQELKDKRAELRKEYGMLLGSFKSDYNSSVRQYEKYAGFMAESFLLDNQIDASIDLLKKSVQNVNAPSVKNLNLLFSLYLQTGKIKQAETVMKKMSEVNENVVEVRLKKAIYQIFKGDLPAAKKLLEKNLHIPPGHNSDLPVQYNNRMYLALLRLIIDSDKAKFNDLRLKVYHDMDMLGNNESKSKLLRLSIDQKKLEQEIRFYDTLTEMTRNSQDAISILKKNIYLLPKHPVIDYLTIRAARVNNELVNSLDRMNNTLSNLGTLSKSKGLHGLFVKSPLFIVEMAESFADLGAEEKAIRLINYLHNRGIYTDESLNLYMRLTSTKSSKQEMLKLMKSLTESEVSADLKENVAGFLIVNNMTSDSSKLIDELPLDSDAAKKMQIAILLNKHKYNKALTLVETLSADKYSKSLLKADIYSVSGDYKNSEIFFKKSLNKANNYQGYREYANFLLEQNKLKEADKIFKEILIKNPNDAASIIGIATILELQGKLNDAVILVKGKYNLNNPFIFLKAAKLYLKIKDYATAVKYADLVLKKIGRNNDAIFIKAIAMINIYNLLPSEQNKKILQSLESYLKKNDTRYNNGTVALIEIAFTLKNYTEVINLADKYIKESPGNAFLMEKYILSSIYSGDLKKAGLLYEDNKQLFNADTAANINSELLLAQGNIKQAIKSLVETGNRNLKLKAALISLKNNNEEQAVNLVKSIKPTCYDWLSLADEANKKNLKQAVKFFEFALSVDPKNPVVLNNFAWSIAKNNINLKDKAVSMALKAYTVLPNKDTLDTCIFVLEKYNMLEKSSEIINSLPNNFVMKDSTILQYFSLLNKNANREEAAKFATKIIDNKNNFYSKELINKLKNKMAKS